MLLAYGDRRAEEVAKTALATAATYGHNPIQAYALNALARIRDRLSDLQGALDYANAAEPFYRSGFDPGGQADNFDLRAGIYSRLGDFDKAAAFNESALRVSRAVKDRGREARILIGYGNLQARRGLAQEALALHRQSLELSRALPNKLTEAQALEAIGVQLARMKQYGAAEESYQGALAIHRELRDRYQQARILGLLGSMEESRGNRSEGLRLAREALALRQALGDKLGVIGYRPGPSCRWRRRGGAGDPVRRPPRCGKPAAAHRRAQPSHDLLRRTATVLRGVH
jgi:tetratricopeptide (TPR) repeat protein